VRNNGEALGRIGQEEEALLGYQWPVFDIQRLASTSSFRPFGAGPWGSRVEKESRKTNSEKKLKKTGGKRSDSAVVARTCRLFPRTPLQVTRTRPQNTPSCVNTATS